MTARKSGRADQEWTSLCERIQKLVSLGVREEAWYLLIAAALVGAPEPDLLASFYTYLTTGDREYAAKDRAEHLSLRFRDVVLKAIPLIGMPRVLCVFSPLAKAEGQLESRAKASKLTKKWHPVNIDVQQIHDRGAATADTIYGPVLLPKIFDTWGSHKEDMRFNELFVAYGLYLSDFEVMTPLETEVVVYSTISCLGLRGPGLWHLRGIGRLLGARGDGAGLSHDERIGGILKQTTGLKSAVAEVVAFVGEDFMNAANVKAWASNDDVVRELGGWGED
ncbi:hypothetical protein LTR99_006351 [Exophiala xenobiotica]|uniref:Uncharacterized protein n=1 Tax=Vermiconidia calcicola TaxID=1690605 RepID=A0AAV9QCA0_9PEZI|nr:hypothetical protein LTR92_010308 [Exophiala xenobiotica]KAK5537521.1 hypothetical protein LTR25_004773 [Vermiconidia calcicola]KAK5539237.1 hypothetical protein LTR23_006653 [Chaetothyriales sp. CCFEE 6169]KAK5242850.1 hypothetical protein LTS06_011241 [Exophiala xenobiotica]KAK5265252.1 hypothetical protein LTR96_009620 [Exophiala xenobiotica]